MGKLSIAYAEIKAAELDNAAATEKEITDLQQQLAAAQAGTGTPAPITTPGGVTLDADDLSTVDQIIADAPAPKTSATV